MSEQASIIEVDEAAEKARAANIRFKQQVLGTVGSAMLFGLVGVATTILLKGGSGLLMSALGMGAVAVVGLGCVYLAAKYLSNVVALDQDAQARKIEAAKLRAKGIEQSMPEVTISRPMGTPFGATHAADAGEKSPEAVGTPATPAPQVPTKTVSNIASHAKMEPAAEMLMNHAAGEQNWASRTAANDVATTHSEQAGRA